MLIRFSKASNPDWLWWGHCTNQKLAMRVWVGCTHNAHIGGACAMRMWGYTHNVHVGVHAQCACVG